jgi:chromosome segregation ATPase
VISIQSIMLVALGFLLATLLALIVAPAYRRRAVRLTTRQLKETLPLDENEVRADKDRLRAEYAIKVHKLEMRLDQAKLERARQTIEIHRRDGKISQIEQQQVTLLAQVDENLNARRVLEQTVADRLPKVEARLNEAKSILFNRDREIADLTQSTKRQRVALDEAHSINAQQTAELERLTNALTVRGARNQQALADPSFEGELALRAEIEALRSKTREQAGLIGRLQSHMGRNAMLALPAGSEGKPPLNGYEAPDVPSPTDTRPAALSIVASNDDQRAQHDREVRSLKAKIDDQNSELARLSAELATLQSGADGDSTGLKDSKIALKARLNAAQAHAEQNAETVKRLRAELAAANERLALQGAHFMEQMRRLGAGTLPAAGQTRRPVTQGQKMSLAERVAQNQSKPTAPAASPAASMSSNGADSAASATVLPLPTAHTANGASHETTSPVSAPEAADLETASADTAPRKPRLIDRISNISKP